MTGNDLKEMFESRGHGWKSWLAMKLKVKPATVYSWLGDRRSISLEKEQHIKLIYESCKKNQYY